MLECNKTITMFPRASRQDVCRQSAICWTDKIWAGSRTCYVDWFLWDISSTERDISFFTKDTIISSVPFLQICRLLRGSVRSYKSSSKHWCQDLLLCEELFCLLHACLVWWLSGDVSTGNASTKTYVHQKHFCFDDKNLTSHTEMPREKLWILWELFKAPYQELQENLATWDRMNVQIQLVSGSNTPKDSQDM